MNLSRSLKSLPVGGRCTEVGWHFKFMVNLIDKCTNKHHYDGVECITISFPKPNLQSL